MGRGGRQYQHPIHERGRRVEHHGCSTHQGGTPRGGEMGGITSLRGGEGIELAIYSPLFLQLCALAIWPLNGSEA